MLLIPLSQLILQILLTILNLLSLLNLLTLLALLIALLIPFSFITLSTLLNATSPHRFAVPDLVHPDHPGMQPASVQVWAADHVTHF
jgi:hypothetical protein